jgi:hypothetical protein
MTELAQRLAAGQPATVPKPSCIQPRPLGRQQAVAVRQQAIMMQQAAPGRPAGSVGPAGPAPGAAVSLPQGDSRRGTARDVLDAVLAGVRLGGRDRQFLSRLVHWDKRNAASVASLLWRARLAGREEAALTQRQLEVMLVALSDAVQYHTSGADAPGCWDCENIPGGRCADHAKDADRARACADLAVFLIARTAPPGLPQPTDIAGYRRQTSVAS